MAKHLPLPKGKYWISAGWRYKTIKPDGHFAYDLAVDARDYSKGVKIPVYAIRGGTVVVARRGLKDSAPWGSGGAKYSGKKGNAVVINSTWNGQKVYQFYNHMKADIKVKKGQKVKAGQLLGYVGVSGNSGGPHLHFAVGKGHWNGNDYAYMWNDGGNSIFPPTKIAATIPTGKPAAKPTVALTNVKPGKKNAQVKLVQQALRALGPEYRKLNPSGATGYYGSQTRNMVKRYQRSLGFKGRDADGRIGCTSLKRLNKANGLKWTVKC